MSITTYGDISPRTAAFVVRDLLKRGMPWLIFEKFGQAKPLPSNSTKSLQFRRYYIDSTFTTGAAATGLMNGDFNPHEYFTGTNFDPTEKTLTEGVTPDATSLESHDLDVTLTQYGDRVVISDVVMDTHEDPILSEAVDILGEQAAVLIEKTRYNVLKAGTTVFYGTGTARAGSIKSPIFRGGGRTFGPSPRDFGFKLNKKVKQLARKSALSYKAKDKAIIVVEDFNFEAPKTKEFADIHAVINEGNKKSLYVLAEQNKNLYLSSRNLKGAKVVTVFELNTYDILHASNLVLAESSIDVLNKTFGIS